MKQAQNDGRDKQKIRNHYSMVRMTDAEFYLVKAAAAAMGARVSDVLRTGGLRFADISLDETNDMTRKREEDLIEMLKKGEQIRRKEDGSRY